MYQPGEFSRYVEAVKADVERGIFTKEEAVSMILDKVQQTLLNIQVTHKQFMLDRMAEAKEVN